MEGGYYSEIWWSHAEDLRPQVELQEAVWEELRWEPEADTADVEVYVDEYVARLRGSVPSYRAKLGVERAAERVPGIREVINDLTVTLPMEDTRTDNVLAAVIANALVWDSRVARVRLSERVVDGWVTLEGSVTSHRELVAAEQAVENLTGVRGVTNLITIEPSQPPPELRRAEAALQHAALRGARISAAANERTVALRGRVHSLADRAAAERAVWDVPGVTALDDRLSVRE
jgi:osmotically-inducible protein OsmY